MDRATSSRALSIGTPLLACFSKLSIAVRATLAASLIDALLGYGG
jgi:hypothetical protein